MSIHALAIHPADPNFAPDAGFRDLLCDCGFLGEEFDLFGDRCFRPGRRFFDHIVFHRSHSVVVLNPTSDGFAESEPRDSRQHCQIELDADDTSGFLCGCNVRDPLCPGCGVEISGWPEVLSSFFKDRQLWACSSCGLQCPTYDVNWQHVAGIARYWIKVRQVYEGEATPSIEFLDLLARRTSLNWRYFWYHL